MTKKKLNPKKVLKERKSLADKLTDDLKDEGLVMFVPTEMTGGTLNIDCDYLTIPSDLTEVPSRDLGKHLNALTQQKAYMRTLSVWQNTYIEEAKRIYYDKYYVVYEELTEEYPKMSEKAKEIHCNNNDYVKEYFLNYRDLQCKLDMIDSTIVSLEELIFLVSREISRRGKDFEELNRNDNIR